MYKYVKNYLTGISDYKEEEVADALEEIRKKKPEIEPQMKEITEYYCSLCDIRFKKMKQHFTGNRHIIKERQYRDRYNKAVTRKKLILKGSKSFFGKGRQLKKMRLFRYAIDFN